VLCLSASKFRQHVDLSTPLCGCRELREVRPVAAAIAAQNEDRILGISPALITGKVTHDLFDHILSPVTMSQPGFMPTAFPQV
jgi:hypothetical protein